MSIFDEQVSRKPDLYPLTEQFLEAAQSNLWTHREFSFQSDIQDFKVNMTKEEQDMIIRSLSCIGQLEISVKKFWAKLGDNLPHPSLHDLGLVFGYQECYSVDTEVLTPSGWRYLSSMKKGDEVYQFNPKTCGLSETTVKDTVFKKYSGKMYEFGEKSNNCLVTPNHDMIIQRQKSYGWEPDKVTAKDLKFHSAIKIPKTTFIENDRENGLTNEERIYIAIQADGTRSYRYGKDGEKILRGVSENSGYSYVIRLHKDRKKNRMDYLLENSSIKYTIGYSKCGKCKIYYIHISGDENYKEFDWIDLKSKSKRWCREFVEELWNWDGSFDRKSYYSKHKKNADFCQHVGILAGYHTIVSSFPDNRKVKDQTKFVTSFSELDHKWRHIMKMKKKEVDYNSTVHCITVDSGAIVTRRKGKPFIAGNCVHGSAYERLLEVLGIEEAFDQVLEMPILKGRVNYLKKYLHKFHSDNRKQFVYSIILFTIFVENIALFSQFYTCMWFRKYKNFLKDTEKQTNYTSNEENLHHEAGCKIISEIKKEVPELFDNELKHRIIEESKNAVEYEIKIIEWILGDFQHEYLNKELLCNFIKNRLNRSLTMIGYEPVFDIDAELLKKTNWFDEQLNGNNQQDFFDNRSVEYVKSAQSFDEESLF